MSFAGDVKAELCRGKLGDKSAAQAEACGVLLYGNRFSRELVKVVTESPAFAQRLPALFRKAFGLTFDEKGDPAVPGKRKGRAARAGKGGRRAPRPIPRTALCGILQERL